MSDNDRDDAVRLCDRAIVVLPRRYRHQMYRAKTAELCRCEALVYAPVSVEMKAAQGEAEVVMVLLSRKTLFGRYRTVAATPKGPAGRHGGVPSRDSILVYDFIFEYLCTPR